MQIITKIEIIQEPAVLFAEGFETKDIPMGNYSYIDIVMVTGKGNTGPSTITFEGRDGSAGTGKPLAFYKRNAEGSDFWGIGEKGDTFMLGGEENATGRVIYRVHAQEMATKQCDRFRIKGTAFASWSGVQTAIIGIYYKPRYTE